MPHAMPLPEKITQDSVQSSESNTLTSTLGNNIRQYADNGLNARRDQWAIQYGVLSKAELNTILNVLELVGGGKDYITWTALTSTVNKKWIVVNGAYSIDVIGGDQFRLTFTLEEDH